MSYDYSKFRETIFTEEGVERLIETRERARRLLSLAGAVALPNLLSAGDNWKAMAVVDYMLERGELREVTNGPGELRHARVFISGQNRITG